MVRCTPCEVAFQTRCHLTYPYTGDPKKNLIALATLFLVRFQ
jgi:hypothetical protein